MSDTTEDRQAGLQELAYHAYHGYAKYTGYGNANDCFCGDTKADPAHFQSSGDAVEWIEDVVNTALAREATRRGRKVCDEFGYPDDTRDFSIRDNAETLLDD